MRPEPQQVPRTRGLSWEPVWREQRCEPLPLAVRQHGSRDSLPAPRRTAQPGAGADGRGAASERPPSGTSSSSRADMRVPAPRRPGPALVRGSAGLRAAGTPYRRHPPRVSEGPAFTRRHRLTRGRVSVRGTHRRSHRGHRAGGQPTGSPSVHHAPRAPAPPPHPRGTLKIYWC